jgi:hypothetical protein
MRKNRTIIPIQTPKNQSENWPMCGEKSREKMTGSAFLTQWIHSYDQNSSDMARWHKLAMMLSISIRFQNIVAAADS